MNQAPVLAKTKARLHLGSATKIVRRRRPRRSRRL
jgi:hypothetical protein